MKNKFEAKKIIVIQHTLDKLQLFRENTAQHQNFFFVASLNLNKIDSTFSLFS